MNSISLALLFLSFPSVARAQTTTRAQLVDEVSALVHARAEKDTFSGAVLLARGDEVLFTFAAGEADKGWHVKNDLETRFNLGSMNKMFTSVSIAQLVEQKKVAYDEPIAKYVDESWLPRAITDKVTVRHLITHTSGLGSYFNETYQKSSRELFREVDDYKPLVQGETLAFEPGTRWSYSNTGMLLLGVVIEKASGENYFEYVRKHVYAPAGMTRSDCYELDQPVENLAVGYERDPTTKSGWRNNLFQHVMRGGPAGGGYSTVGDLHRFAQALLAGKLVSVESLDTLWTRTSGADYGCGFQITDKPQKVVGHSGGFPGINSNLDVFVDSGYVVVMMSNYGEPTGALAQELRKKVLSATE
ncbi:MAG: class A beta-lactamase-related serine hydrolase [Planctomycetes bacterium]|nr:class A beta-lactamase-related serine hydrolase [Planctomycetota bacterium]